MSTKTKSNTEITKETTATASEFFLYELREHSKQLFGVKPEVVDGAFLNVKEQKITKDRAEKLIKDFLKKEVK